MVRVSLAQFIDFLIARGATRVTKVRDVRAQLASETEFQLIDYYHPLRRALNECLSNDCDVSHLQRCVENLTDAKKVDTYRLIVKSLCTFFDRHVVEYHAVPRQTWHAGDLAVGVRPLGQLTIDGEERVVIAYWKADPLDRFRVESTLHLLARTHGQYGTPTVFEVRTGKLFAPGRRRPRGLDALLNAEAQAFLTMWASDLDAA